MAAVGMWLRNEWRRRRMAWFGLALLAGLVGGTTTAAVAGARRTSSAFPRLVQWSRATDISSGGPKDSFREANYLSYIEAVERLPQVAESVRTYTPSTTVITADRRRTGAFELYVLVEPTNRATVTLDRAKIVAGRRPDPRRADEASLSFAAQGPGLHLGDRVRVVLALPDGSHELAAPVRIVGLHAVTGDFPSVSSPSFRGLYLSPAFFTRYRAYIADDSNQLSIAVRLRRGARDVRPFLAEVDRHHIPLDFPTTNAEFAAGVQRSMRFEADALWLFASLIGGAGVVIVGQAIARETAAGSGNRAILGALGMSDRQIFLSSVGRAFVIGVGGAAIGMVLAIAASPLAPIGLARIAEPHPGLRVDGVAISLGAAATIFAVVLASLPSAATNARTRRRNVAHKPSGRVVVERFARSGASAPAVAGAQMALEPAHGAGTSARTWISGAAGGIAALAAALIFSASLHHLIATPRLSGYVWDVWLGGGPNLPGALEADRRVVAFAPAAGFDVSVERRPVFTVALDQAGPIRPLLIDGRAPERSDEIALGRKTMREVHARIGGTIRLAGVPAAPGKQIASMRVVGLAVIPPLIFRSAEPGEGAFVTLAGLERVYGSSVRDQGVYVARIQRGIDIRNLQLPAFTLPRRTAGQLTTLSGVSSLPLVLAGLLGLIGFATLLQILVTAGRRRRKDIAILMVLGFIRRQAHAMVAWQTTAMVSIALAVGVPLGAIGGRWAWKAFADQVAVYPAPRVPVLAVIALIPGTIIIGNLIALLPARAASRTRPAHVLRTE